MSPLGKPPREPQPLFRHHVRRPRLTQRLDETTAQAIVFLAPAGYGKTTLAVEWLSEKRHVAWYRASSGSADLVGFSQGIIAAVRPFIPDAGNRLAEHARAASMRDIAVRPLAELLAEDLLAWPREAWLVIDDYHLVAESAHAEELVDWLLTLTPMHVLVTTRRRPSWASARRVLYGELAEINRDDLVMTRDEASGLLAGRSEGAIRRIVAQANGWPVLLGLASLSEGLNLPDDLPNQALFRYFAEEVFRHQGPTLQDFMLVASVPTAIDNRRAVLSDGAESSVLFDRLVDDGLLHSVDEHRFAFHPLLRSFLRQKLETRNPSRIADLAQRAVTDARAERRWEDAFELATESRFTDLAADIVIDAATDLFTSGRLETLETWLRALDPVVLARPELLVVKANVLLRKGRQAEASALAREAAELANDDAAASRAWLVAGDAFHLVSDDGRALEAHVRAKDMATSIVDRRRALWGAFNASLSFRAANPEAYLDELEVVAGNDVDTRLRIGTGRILVKAQLHGTFQGAWDILEPLLPIEHYGQDPLARSVFLANAANVCVGRADYARGRDIAAKTLDLCRSLHLDFATGFCLMHRAAAEIGLRQFRQAKRTLATLFEITRRHQDPFLAVEARALRLKLALSSQEFRTLPPALLAVPDRDDLPPGPCGELLALISLAKALTGRSDEACELAIRARACTASVESNHFALLSDLLVASAGGQKRAGTVTADTVLGRARRDQFFDAIVLGYRTSPLLLMLFAASREFNPLLTRLMNSANDARIAADAGLAAADACANGTETSVLTARETQVLALLVRGLSNGEIAAELVISRSTAKVHVHHVLEKLGARTRLEAAAKGREYLFDAG